MLVDWFHFIFKLKMLMEQQFFIQHSIIVILFKLLLLILLESIHYLTSYRTNLIKFIYIIIISIYRQPYYEIHHPKEMDEEIQILMV